MLALRNAGALTLAQSGQTCVVDGMPRAARMLGAAGEVVPLDEMGAKILELTTAGARARAGLGQ